MPSLKNAVPLVVRRTFEKVFAGRPLNEAIRERDGSLRLGESQSESGKRRRRNIGPMRAARDGRSGAAQQYVQVTGGDSWSRPSREGSSVCKHRFLGLAGLEAGSA